MFPYIPFVTTFTANIITINTHFISIITITNVIILCIYIYIYMFILLLDRGGHWVVVRPDGRTYGRAPVPRLPPRREVLLLLLLLLLSVFILLYIHISL